MDLLKQRILAEGRALNEEVLLVDSFLNHQVDPELMRAIGREFAQHFADMGITRVATIESSGIAPAVMTALEMQLPLVILKKQTSRILSEEVFQATVRSFTKGTQYELTLKRKYMPAGEKVLFIDDFLASGEASLGMLDLLRQAGAELTGIGIVIEKAFQSGHARLEELGCKVCSLARVGHMAEDCIEFVE